MSISPCRGPRAASPPAATPAIRACAPASVALSLCLALLPGPLGAAGSGDAAADGGSAGADAAADDAAPPRRGDFLERAAVRDWIRATSAERGLDPQRVAGLLARVSSRDDILAKIAAPAERTLTWREYRPIFLGERRVAAGRDFLAEHAATFERAASRFGVPAEVIAAIIGVETFYGRYRGGDGVLESLATLAFDYPPRAAFFAAELAEFLVLADAEGWDPLAIEGSYAGAMGMPQFISSSYRAYAIDFDGDGAIDLFDDTADVIGSVANYLDRHGWRRGQPVAARWRPTGATREAARALVRESLKPAVAPATLRELGFDGADAAGDAPMSVMTFAGDGGEELWVGYTNFYAITRYNHSRLYALAVHQLAEALRRGPGEAGG